MITLRDEDDERCARCHDEGVPLVEDHVSGGGLCKSCSAELDMWRQGLCTCDTSALGPINLLRLERGYAAGIVPVWLYHRAAQGDEEAIEQAAELVADSRGVGR